MRSKKRDMLFCVAQVVAMVAVILFLMAIMGCNEVQMTPPFSEALDRSAVEAREWNTRAQSNVVSCGDIKAYLEQNAVQWTAFQAAKDGS